MAGLGCFRTPQQLYIYLPHWRPVPLSANEFPPWEMISLVALKIKINWSISTLPAAIWYYQYLDNLRWSDANNYLWPTVAMNWQSTKEESRSINAKKLIFLLFIFCWSRFSMLYSEGCIMKKNYLKEYQNLMLPFYYQMRKQAIARNKQTSFTLTSWK